MIELDEYYAVTQAINPGKGEVRIARFLEQEDANAFAKMMNKNFSHLIYKVYAI